MPASGCVVDRLRSRRKTQRQQALQHCGGDDIREFLAASSGPAYRRIPGATAWWDLATSTFEPSAALHPPRDEDPRSPLVAEDRFGWRSHATLPRASGLIGDAGDRGGSDA